MPAKLICPCCKGKTYLLVYEEQQSLLSRLLHHSPAPTKHRCCHCQGTGYVVDSNLSPKAQT